MNIGRFFKALTQTPEQHTATMARLEIAKQILDFANALGKRSMEYSEAAGFAREVQDFGTAYRAIGRAGALHEVGTELIALAKEIVEAA